MRSPLLACLLLALASPAIAGIDLTIQKTRASALVSGSTATYHLRAQNLGTDATTAATFVRDTLPAELVYSYASGDGWTVTVSGAVVTGRYGAHLQPGETAGFDLYASVQASPGDTVVNSATVSTSGDTDTANNLATDSARVLVNEPDLLIDKSHYESFIQGHPSTYTFTITNQGAGPAAGVTTVRDTLPAGLTFLSSSPGSGWSISHSGQIVTATYSQSIGVGFAKTFTVTVTPGPSSLPSVTNFASVFNAGDAEPGNNRDSDVTPVEAVVDIAISKRHSGAFSVGFDGLYTVVVSNVGAVSTDANINVTDALPAGMTGVSVTGDGWVGSINGTTVTALYGASIAPGDSAWFTLRVHVGPDAYPSATNYASVATENEDNVSNNSAFDPTVILGTPDLTIDKRHTTPFPLGGTGTYRMVVRNVSSETSSTVTVRDTLPAGLSYVSGSGAGWTVAESGGIVTATYPGSVAPFDSAVFTITVAVGQQAYPLVTNSATVSQAQDVNPSNDTDADPTALAIVDLAIDKRHTTPFAVGTNGVYRIVLRNLGGVATTGAATVRDTLPAGMSIVSASGAGWSAGISGDVVTLTYASPIAPYDSTAVNLTVAVAGTAYPGVVNAATVSTPEDSNAVNDRDVDPTAVSRPDLAMDKRHTVPFGINGSASYRIVVRNVGGGTASPGAVVRDTVPAALNVTGLGSLRGPWSFGQAGQVVTGTLNGGLAPGDSASFFINVDVGAAAYPSVTNAATVSHPDDVNPANDRDVDPTAVGKPDLVMDKRHTVPFVVGGSAHYSIVVRDIGTGSAAPGAVVRDTVPAELGITGLDFVRGLWSLSSNGQIVTGTLNGLLAPGDSAIFSITVDVSAAAYPSVTNAATVTHVDDANPANDRDVDVAAVKTSDLTIDKRHTMAFGVGANGDYRIVLRNVGTAPTNGSATVRDTLPAGMSFVSASGTGWSGAVSTGVVTLTYSNPIVPGDSAGVIMTVSVGEPAFPAVVNAATVSTPSDLNPANDRDVDPTAVGRADLTIDKRHTEDFYVVTNGFYRLVVTNVGTGAAAAGAVVRDTIPEGLNVVGMGGLLGDWTYGLAGKVVTATINGGLAVGDSAVFSVTVAVSTAAYPSVTNAASVSLAGDTDPDNDRDVDPTRVAGCDLSIDKRHTSAFVAGQNGTYAIAVTNLGGAPAFGATTVSDTLPNGLLYVSGGGEGWTVSASGSVVTGTHTGTIAPGDSVVMGLVVFVGGAAMPVAINRASVATSVDVDPANNVDEDQAPIGDGVLAVPTIPDRLALDAVSPNPLRARARVTFSMPRRSVVHLSVIDIQGREIAVVADGEHTAGVHAVMLDAARLPAGLYFVRLRCEGAELKRRIAVVR